MMKRKKALLKRKRVWSALFALAVLLTLILWPSSDKTTKATASLTADVRRGPLVINIEESGTIEPNDQIVIKSKVEGKTTIISIVPDGSMATNGQLLVELDVSTKRDEAVNQEIEVTKAESDVVVKEEELEIAKNQAASDVELAEQELAFAKEDLVKYAEGEYPNELATAQGEVALAEQELEQSKEKYNWSKKLNAEKFLSDTELKSDELSWKSKQLSVKTKRGNVSLLEKYTHHRKMTEYESGVKQKTANYERVKRKAHSSVVQAESALLAKKSELARQKLKLEKLREQIAAASVRAPVDGQVIYGTSSGWRREEPLKEGTEVNEGRKLVVMPSSDRLKAVFSINESRLASVRTGLIARIRTDTLPDKVFSGSLVKIAPMPTSDNWLNRDLKQYPSEILLAEDASKHLRNGMNCKVELIVEQYDDVLYIPVQCVVRIDAKPYVYVRGKLGDERRAVETGLDNDTFVRILSGLAEGEKVLLSPPLDTSVKSKETEKGPDAAK